MKTKFFLTTTLMLGTAAMLVAQDSQPQQGRPQENRPPQGRPSGGQGGQGGQSGPGMQGGQGRPSMPLIDALDVNKNHVIDADEIANASANLKKLDKNGDGKLTPDEFLPMRPGGFGGGQGGQGGGQSGQRGPGGQQGRPGTPPDQNGGGAPPQRPQ